MNHWLLWTWVALLVLGIIRFGWWALTFGKRFDAASEIIGRDDASGNIVTRAQLERVTGPNPMLRKIDRFSGNSHDRRVQRRAYARQEKTPLS